METAVLRCPEMAIRSVCSFVRVCLSEGSSECLSEPLRNSKRLQAVRINKVDIVHHRSP